MIATRPRKSLFILACITIAIMQCNGNEAKFPFDSEDYSIIQEYGDIEIGDKEIDQELEDEEELESLLDENENKKSEPPQSAGSSQKQSSMLPQKQYRIAHIYVEGNKFCSKDAILTYIPYKVGELFDARKSRQLIHKVYYGLKRFRNVSVKIKIISPTMLDVYIEVEEKIPLRGVIFKGNSHLSEKDINKKIDFSTIYAIDPEELQQLAIQIKKMYAEKGYNSVEIETQLDIDDEQKGTATFTIKEGKHSTLKKIRFSGNDNVSRKELKNILLSKEDWVLGFMDRSGTYHPEMVEYGDRQALEHFYQNRGYLHARVAKIITDVEDRTKNITLTYEIDEGERYCINEVHASGNDILSEEYILSRIPMRPGMLFSREAISNSIKRIERLWGNKGYIFAHVEPTVIPDDATKTVKVSFHSQIGNRVNLNRLTIRGNKKTRDKIIRRRISLEEGGLITQDRMDVSKNNVESLGYFDARDGVLWKLKRLDQETADLDLVVKETKTGNFGLKFGFGGSATDIQSPASDFSVSANMSDTNLFGSGIYLNTNAAWSKAEQSFLFHLAQPWLFDKPILGAMDIYFKRPTFDELHHVRSGRSNAVHEKLTGGSVTLGYISQSTWELFHDTNMLGSFGVDGISYQAPVLAAIPQVPTSVNADYQKILNKSFAPGEFVWLSASFEQDARNHPVHTSRGHKWKLNARVALPVSCGDIGFYKVALDAGWYTPLINEYDLVFKLHGYFGITQPLPNRVIPFGELYHIGGPTSVRGYLFGQIGPKYADDSIGSQKAFFINAELVFPIVTDMTIKGLFFYDGGAGWDNPYTDEISLQNCPYLTNNRFTYRHSVGVGLRLLKPMPMRIDWGFKIDPIKNKVDPSKGETPYEVHFGMSYDW